LNGIVVKEIDFLPQRIKRARGNKRQKLIFAIASFLLIALIGLAVWIPFKLEKDYLAKAGALDEKLSALNRAAPVYNQMLAKQKEYEQKRQTLETLAKSDFKVLPFLEKISEATPAGAYISQLSVTAGEGANITFITRDPVETAALVVGLRRLDVFERVDIETVPFMGGSKPVQLNLRFNWAGEKPGEDGQKDAKKEPDKGADINAAVKDIERKIKPQ